MRSMVEGSGSQIGPLPRRFTLRALPVPGRILVLSPAPEKVGADVTAAVTPAPTGPWEEVMPVKLRTVLNLLDTVASDLQ
jgi:hypothetical protein